MSTPAVGLQSLVGSIAQQTRFVRAIAATEFKLKYAGSALGYLWSVLKPLAIFSVLYVIFGRLLRLGTIFDEYPIYLLLGIVVWIFFSDAASSGMVSIYARADLLRKVSFPRVVVPIAATTTAAITFFINALVIVAFMVYARIVPRLDWLAIVPLLLELYFFVVGVALLLATLFVRFRDIAQIWELLLQLLFYATPIIYPVSILPSWAQKIAFLNPFTQVLQDIRALLLYRAPSEQLITAGDVYGRFGHLVPLAVAAGVFAIGRLAFRRDEPWLAERV